jgi:hypothetical protein
MQRRNMGSRFTYEKGLFNLLRHDATRLLLLHSSKSHFSLVRPGFCCVVAFFPGGERPRRAVESPRTADSFIENSSKAAPANAWLLRSAMPEDQAGPSRFSPIASAAPNADGSENS